MADRNPLGQFRLRRLALQFRQFTVNELKAAAGVSPETVYGFIHDLKQQGDLFKTESLEAEGPGRPTSRYILTADGVEFLASQNLAVAKELNELAFQEDPSLRPGSRKARTSSASARRLGAGLHIKGEITGTEDFQIDGSVEGLIQMPRSKVTILASAKVTADIIAREVVIYGRAKGNIRVSERVEIKKDGSLTGDVTTARVMIEDGAYFKGSITIDKSGTTETDKNQPAVAAGRGQSMHKAAESR